jgi:flagellar M-ring protein FliF
LNGESSASRTYELGREVAVANGTPGKIRRISVAVALSAGALKKTRQQDVEQLKQLIGAAVGADPARGDQIAVVLRAFEATDLEALPVWEQPWMMTYARHAVALVGLILVLLLGVRPLVRALKGRHDGDASPQPGGTVAGAAASGAPALAHQPLDAAALGQQVGLAQRIVAERPDEAVLALREMLAPPAEQGAAA